MTPRITILGIGNVLMGDDALGPWVLELLAARWHFPDDVEVLEAGTPGLDLTVHLADRDAVVVVDVVKARGAPGELRRYALSQILERSPVLATSPHDPGLREALLTLDFAGGLPRRLDLVGVIPGDVEARRGLTPAVQAAVPQALEAVLALARELGAAPEPRHPARIPNLWWEREGRRIHIRGTVQGVGMRPFVYREAHAAGVAGRVLNHAEGVTIEAFGARPLLDDLEARLATRRPAAARYDVYETEPIPDVPVDTFVIDDSPAPAADAPRRTTIPPDLATCDACLAEVDDPEDRRHRYPFTNCTHCGPRFTIVREVPYDRPGTTMAPFTMCPECHREYGDVHDRRFHAQPDACPVCGPRLQLLDASGRPAACDDPLAEAARRLADGHVVAVKGLGGFHLACDATRSESVRLLRRRKLREEKPLAVMPRDLAEARRLARLDPEEEALLTGPERPIVLARRREGAGLAPEIAPDTRLLGLMLPYTPLHHLLVRAAGRPLVLTSGNVSDEPIAVQNDEAVRRLAGLADAFLVHDRAIESRADDSVARVIDGVPTLLRRSRGWVPRPVRLARRVRPVLGVGAHLKNTFCLARDDEAVLGPHIGDLETVEAYEALEASIARLQRFLALRPEAVACDLHPGYLSTRLARATAERLEVPLVPVQHHHAHLVACAAEHRLEGPVLGLVWDGTGHGADGAAWGSELLLGDAAGFRRLATFRPLRLAGGDAAVRQPWRAALALLDDAFEGEPPLDRIELFAAVPEGDVAAVRRMIHTGLNAPPSHGAGRYFDALGALALARPLAAYEGQVALALDDAAEDAPAAPYPFALRDDVSPWQVDLRPMVRAAVTDLVEGAGAARVSARFHATLAEAGAATLRRALQTEGKHAVVLSGGVFQNGRLAPLLTRALGGAATVHRHREVPPGDGGIALGQALAADAALANGGV